MTEYRIKGGRRPEDFPEARARDKAVLACLRSQFVGATRNQVARLLEIRPRLITRSLYRLRERGLVEHVAHGYEGHGFWVTTIKGNEER